MKDGTFANRADEPFFRARLLPHRSLGRTGFLLLMLSLLLAWLVVGAIFLSHGAWPVAGYCGLDLLAIYIAFRLNYRSARASEEISLSRTCLEIRQTAPSGRAHLHRFNPFWTRFDVARHGEAGITHMTVASRNAIVQIGGFLNPDDRENFASAFTRALATAQQR